MGIEETKKIDGNAKNETTGKIGFWGWITKGAAYGLNAVKGVYKALFQPGKELETRPVKAITEDKANEKAKKAGEPVEQAAEDGIPPSKNEKIDEKLTPEDQEKQLSDTNENFNTDENEKNEEVNDRSSSEFSNSSDESSSIQRPISPLLDGSGPSSDRRTSVDFDDSIEIDDSSNFGNFSATDVRNGDIPQGQNDVIAENPAPQRRHMGGANRRTSLLKGINEKTEEITKKYNELPKESELIYLQKIHINNRDNKNVAELCTRINSEANKENPNWRYICELYKRLSNQLKNIKSSESKIDLKNIEILTNMAELRSNISAARSIRAGEILTKKLAEKRELLFSM